ncbi:MAG: stage sporulation protein [Clostridiales bacterium]|jgi:stage V sporulation protein B|nr:stage sporulation protein [Clostridiales bacterium]
MKNKFAKELGLLGVIGILIKIIGSFYRVPLAYIMSEDAVSYYAIAYPWYLTLIVISTTALPAVVSKLTAEASALGDETLQYDTFVIAKKLMMLFGAFTLLCLSVGAKGITSFLGYPQSFSSFVVLGIASFFVALNSAYRGLFQGTQHMNHFGYSQLVEQLGRVCLGLLMVWGFVKIGLGDGMVAAAGTSGAAYGAVVSWLFALWVYKREYKPHKASLRDHRALVKRIVKMAVPIALGASIFPLLTIIDSTMVIARLRATGFGNDAGVMYSYLSFYGAPIIGIAEAVIIALQVSLLPMISRSHTLKDSRLDRQIYLGIRLSVFIGLPMSLGMAGLSEPILLLLYPSKAELMGDAGVVLMWLGLGVVFLSVYQATTGMLQGVGKYKVPVINLVIGACVKVVLGYVLLGIPTINVNGAAISTLVAYALAALLNVIALTKTVAMPQGFMLQMIKIMIANVVMLAVAKESFRLITPMIGFRLGLIAAILLAAVTYVVLTFLLKLIVKQDLENMEGHHSTL